jgi:hypothetical protein
LWQCAEGDNIRALGYVEQQDLPGLYTGAEVFAFPSLYEGYGMPVAEALACGTRVLATNIPALREAGESIPCTLSRRWRGSRPACCSRWSRLVRSPAGIPAVPGARAPPSWRMCWSDWRHRARLPTSGGGESGTFLRARGSWLLSVGIRYRAVAGAICPAAPAGVQWLLTGEYVSRG